MADTATTIKALQAELEAIAAVLEGDCTPGQLERAAADLRDLSVGLGWLPTAPSNTD